MVLRGVGSKECWLKRAVGSKECWLYQRSAGSKERWFKGMLALRSVGLKEWLLEGMMARSHHPEEGCFEGVRAHRL